MYIEHLEQASMVFSIAKLTLAAFNCQKLFGNVNTVVSFKHGKVNVKLHCRKVDTCIGIYYIA